MRIRITDIQRFCTHDGPGIRTTVFFQGCPLRCVWCQNPECQTAEPCLRFTASRCIGCEACAAVCPNEVHRVSGGEHEVVRARCAACGRCAEACPTAALGLAGEGWEPGEVMSVVKRDRAFYEASGGGMTLSGGEPLWQAEGARALLELARREGIDTAVETCGFVEWAVIESVRDAVGLWLYDVKHVDPRRHRRMTAESNERIISNLDRLLSAGAEVILRMPVIPRSNEGEGAIEQLAEWLRGRPGIREVHLMPYNRLAESKYRSLGLEYALAGLEAPTEEELDGLKARLQGTGVRVRVGG
ncbi:MAG: glycyl-radical enzyme activating protein [Armatimonadota bacterium]|nr:MAG: glycyl-radical enzyme activating protein [Armatimonadota bacterium]